MKMRKKLPLLSVGDSQEGFADAMQKSISVEARELHKQIGAKTVFRNWIKRKLASSRAIEGEDYFTYLSAPEGLRPKVGETSKNLGGRPNVDYHLTVDLAKHLAMLEGNEVGHMVRSYFILSEKLLHKMALWNIPRAATKSIHSQWIAHDFQIIRESCYCSSLHSRT